MNQRAKSHTKISSARSRRAKNRRSIVIFTIVAVLLLIGAIALQRRPTPASIAQANANAAEQAELLPLADSIKPLRGGHDMDMIPSRPPQPKPTQEGVAVPQVMIPWTNHDFGEIPVSPTVAVVYTIQNVGTEDLKLSNLVTSCGCTTAELSTSIIPPGQRADMKVVFDPGYHETVGPVTRLVWMKTNDPIQPWLELTLTANVLPAP